MEMRMKKAGLLGAALLAMVGMVQAHPGGVDQQGGHRDKASGEYHCHRGECDKSMMKSEPFIEASHKHTAKIVDEPRYVRDMWMSRWTDKDGDCRDTRHELLADTSVINAVLSPNECRVLGGTWKDQYTGETFHRPKDLDLDHIVPLAYMHRNGGSRWPRELREQFAEDPDNLLLVSASANRSKSDKGPSKWLPKENLCTYHDQWRKMQEKYQIDLPKEDDMTLIELYRAKCAEFQPGPW
jgi:hypothetical protein